MAGPGRRSGPDPGRWAVRRLLLNKKPGDGSRNRVYSPGTPDAFPAQRPLHVGVESRRASCPHPLGFLLSSSTAAQCPGSCLLYTSLVRRGRRQYAMLAVSRSNWGVKQEQDGFRAVLSEHGIPDDHIIITETGYGISDGYQAMRQLLSRKPEIDAVFVAADEIAVGAVNAVRDLGRRIPEDIAVVSLGDTKLAEIISPKLTTARYFYRESGVEAAEMLLEMMEGKNLTARVWKMGFEVICRETV